MQRLFLFALILSLLTACNVGQDEAAPATPLPTLNISAATLTPTTNPPTLAPTQTPLPTATISTSGAGSSTSGGAVSRPVSQPSAQLPPTIRSFTTTSAGVTRPELRSGNARIPVSWAVDNRPDNSNLVFEQIMPDGAVRNAELPREVALVPSSGAGMVAPTEPANASAGEVVIRLRLVNLSNNNTLVSAEIRVPIVQTPGQVYTRDQCFSAPFWTDYVDVVGGVRYQVIGDALPVYDSAASMTVAATLQPGTLVTAVNNDPYCFRPAGSETAYRRWQVQGEGVNGWVNEYDPGATPQPNLEITIAVRAFDVQPRTIASGQPVTVTWDVEGMSGASIYVSHNTLRHGWTPLSLPDGSLPGASGSIQYTFPATAPNGSFTLVMPGEMQQNISVTITCPPFFVVTDSTNCPAGAVTQQPAVYQPFERGFMVWHNQIIYAFYQDGRGAVRQDAFTGTEPAAEGEVPAGLFRPVRGFGQVWASDAQVREALGWATAAESTYTREMQTTRIGYAIEVHFFSLPDGRLIAAEVGWGALTWETTTRR